LLNHPLWRSALQPLLYHPWHTDELLDFCEMVMMDGVQLDSFGVSAFPGATPASAAALAGEQLRPPTFAWHRDNFAQSQYYQGGAHGGFAGGERYYRPPRGMNLLCYLQDMNSQTGPLRAVPGSHLGVFATPTGDTSLRPHPEELLLDLKAGEAPPTCIAQAVRVG
jgi:hypothetical protein